MEKKINRRTHIRYVVLGMVKSVRWTQKGARDQKMVFPLPTAVVSTGLLAAAV
jgi:hypothetical protein